MGQLAEVFAVKWQGFNLRRFAVFAVVLGLLIIVGVLPHERRYFLSAIFGALFLALADPGGKYAYRVARLAVFAVAGALLTALGFGAVLIAMDVPHPSNLTDEGRRILFTFAGVGIAIIVLLLAGLLQKRTAAKAAPQAPVPEGQAG
jgi:hypothetical protein